MKKTIKAYVARDKDNLLFFYKEKPQLRIDGTFIAQGMVYDKTVFPEIQKCEWAEVTITYDQNCINAG